MNRFSPSFQSCLFTGLLTACSLSINAQNAWINEIHYDNISGDVNELVEVIVENPGDYTLSSFQVVLYNGSGGGTYTPTYHLGEFTVGNSTGNFTIYYKIYPVNGIQNGAPDGLALVYNGTVISGQFLSYEGVVTATNGPASGTNSVNIGVSENGTEAAGLSLQLTGNGSQYSDFTWLSPATATAGALNNGQTITTGGVENPANFNAQALSTTEIGLSWELNGSGDSVVIAQNSSSTFGTPSGVYTIGGGISGGGTVIYKGLGITANHTGLTANAEYFYKAWSKTSADVYSTGVLDSATTQSLEPTDHPSGITAVSNGPVNITVSWNDSDADHYLVKGSSTGFSSIVEPVDGVAHGDSLLVKNINEAVQTHQFTGLTPNTTYFFKIFPYNGTGSASNYKLDGTVPQASAVTDILDLDLVISEVADPRDSSLAKFVEISNIGITTIDFSTTPVYLGRQSNGGTISSLQISGTLTAGGSRVIGYVFSSADTMRFFNAFGFVPDQYSNLVSGNGDDGYFLYYGGDHNTGYRFDAYGVINVDGTSEPWEYTDKKAVRKRTVTSPSSTWNASEWVIPAAFTLVKDMTPGIYRTDITWQGNASTNWNARGANWNSPYGFIPDASNKVIIPNTSNYPVITEPSFCHQIEIQSGSALIIQSTGMLQIIGQ